MNEGKEEGFMFYAPLHKLRTSRLLSFINVYVCTTGGKLIDNNIHMFYYHKTSLKRGEQMWSDD